MRATTLLRRTTNLKDTRFTRVRFNKEGIVAEVAPAWRSARCPGCGVQRPGYDRRPSRQWRHLDMAGMKLVLEYNPRRVDCKKCGVVVEQVPWASAGSRHTRPFEDMIGYLAQRCDKTTIANMMRIAWATVGSIIERVVARHGLKDRLADLVYIGVDEISYRRHHNYLTVVIDHFRGEVVWAHPGKSADTLKAFFDELGEERCGQIEAVTVDLAGGYIKAITEASPAAKLIFDRFHIQRLAHDALDEVRRDEVRQAEESGDRSSLKKTRWALQKNPWNLTRFESEKLAELQRSNKRLYRAYLLKEALVGVLDRRQVNVARRKLKEWLAWAGRSRLAPFKKLARTIRSRMEGILEYVRYGCLSNGRSEGINRKIRTITTRSYGFHGAASLIAMITLCCSGIILQPVHVYPGVAA